MFSFIVAIAILSEAPPTDPPAITRLQCWKHHGWVTRAYVDDQPTARILCLFGDGSWHPINLMTE